MLHPSETVHLFMSDQDVDTVGPLRVDENLPGYESTSFTFLAARVANGEIASYEHVFKPYVDGGFGSLDLELVGADDWPPQPQGRLGTWATLTLVDQDFGDPARPVNIHIPEFRGRHTVEGIPYGKYSLRFELCDGAFVQPDGVSEELVVLVSDSPSSVMYVDVSRLGSLEIEVTSADGGTYAGQFSVMLGESSGFNDDGNLEIHLVGRGAVTFRRPPYILSGLFPGQYAAYVIRPLSSGAAPQSWTVFIEGNSSTSAAIMLPQ
jgi:hypothetical protein